MRLWVLYKIMRFCTMRQPADNVIAHIQFFLQFIHIRNYVYFVILYKQYYMFYAYTVLYVFCDCVLYSNVDILAPLRNILCDRWYAALLWILNNATVHISIYMPSIRYLSLTLKDPRLMEYLFECQLVVFLSFKKNYVLLTWWYIRLFKEKTPMKWDVMLAFFKKWQCCKQKGTQKK